MEIRVLIEQMPSNGYRATGPFAFTAEGPTEEEALRQLRELIQVRLTGGVRLASLDISEPVPPWKKYACMWSPDDPLIEEWKQAIEEYRQEMDKNPEVR